jgi:subfamily B ATP-binding cassette protein MsbA
LLPTLLAFVFFLYRLLPHLKHLAASRTTLSARLSSVKDVTALLDRADKTYTASGTIPFRRFENDVRFKSVSFAYKPEDGPVLNDVSLSIPRGKTTAIVGPSGAGKSTLANLLFRLYDPAGGELRVDGIPLRHLDVASWRESIAFAGQDSHLFSGTVFDNIAYGNPRATLEEIVAAADLAAADGFIRRLPHGYQTRVGDRGLRLSAGERQRIVLARAFLRKPQILVLDEATNALDSLSEHRIRLALKKFGEDSTVVLIAHRMSTVEHADQIVVMDGGRIVERGTYEELLRRGGTFTELSRMQQQRRIAAGPG